MIRRSSNCALRIENSGSQTRPAGGIFSALTFQSFDQARGTVVAQLDLTVDLVVVEPAEMHHVKEFDQYTAAAVFVALGHELFGLFEGQRSVLEYIDRLSDALVAAFADLHDKDFFFAFHIVYPAKRTKQAMHPGGISSRWSEHAPEWMFPRKPASLRKPLWHFYAIW
jgi:hypothetical protein